MMNKTIRNISLSAMFLALALILPFFTGQIPEIGNMLLPMHLPVMFCGLICTHRYGAIVGFIAPLLRSLIFGMPLIYPSAIAMAFELMTYGFAIGYLYEHSKWQCVVALYRSLIIAMILGRLVWGLAEVILLGVRGNSFGLSMFISGAFLEAIPGIILQLVFIPLVMMALNKAGIVTFKKKELIRS